LLEGFGFAPTSFIRLGLFGEGDFAVLTDSAVPTDFLVNATPPITGTSWRRSRRRSAETLHALLHDIKYAKLGGAITGISYLTFDGHPALRSSDTLSLNTPLGTHISFKQTQYFVGANGFLYALTLSGNDPNLAAIASSFSTS
jgi:hypothetical protein